MSLQNNIMAEMKVAMKNKNKTTLEALRAIKAAILLAQTDTGAKKNLSEAEENKILQKSFLFYSTKEEDPSKKIQNTGKKGENTTESAATYNNENSVNDVKYKLFVDDITNMLYGMGEQDMASWFKNRAKRCLNNLEGVKKEYKQMKIEECFQDIFSLNSSNLSRLIQNKIPAPITLIDAK